MDSTTENVFRFVQLRPVFPAGPDVARLTGTTAFARQMAAAAPAERARLAQELLDRPNGLDRYLDGKQAAALIAIGQAAVAAGRTVAELRTEAAHIAGAGAELDRIHADLSDALLAAKFAGRCRYRSQEIASLYRITELLVESDQAAVPAGAASDLLRHPVALPDGFPVGTRPTVPAIPAVPALATVPDALPLRSTAAQVQTAFEEIWLLLRPESVTVAAEPDADSGARSFTLTEPAQAGLSPATRSVLDQLGLKVDQQPVDAILQRLDAEVARLAGREVGEPAAGGAPATHVEVRPYLRDVGVADLLVVKQHLKEYQRVDLAHIENVLKGEHKSRNHRDFERTEETITTERETSQERQTELETADRFELNRETSRTAQRDQEFSAGLTISGKYGPTVDFTNDLQASLSMSTEETTRNATRYAKDIVSRSLDRVVERVREEVVRKVLREQEETNLHELTNETNEHTNGVYQFVEKVYESQVFNYGLRQMFDFMVPEPASYIWHLEDSATDFNLPAPPPSLDSQVPSASAVNASNYLQLAAKFGADDVVAPPASMVIAGVGLSHGEDNDSESGQPRSLAEKEITVPEGYRPIRALVRPQVLTDDVPALAITVGHSQQVWRPPGSQLRDVGSGYRMGSANLSQSLLTDSYPYDAAGGKLPVQVLAFETNSYSAAVNVVFQRTEEAYRAWQIATYAKLLTAYRNLAQKYDEQVAELKAQAEAEAARTTIRFGAPPSQNQRIVLGELKKHCLSIVTRQRYEDFDIVQHGDPPYFDFAEAAAAGSFIRFFEQAFEWDQMQYVCYPYFWGGRERWARRFLRQDVDQQFLEFLQAGAARVVVPVRPGFELALTHYLETGEIWDNIEQPPPVNSQLYLPIVAEIQERTGAPQDEIPVGRPWATYVPTPLVILRPHDDLPQWTRPDPAVWEWQEVSTPGGHRG